MLINAEALRRSAGCDCRVLAYLCKRQVRRAGRAPYQAIAARGGQVGGQSLTEPVISIYLCMFRGERSKRPAPSPYISVPMHDYRSDALGRDVSLNELAYWSVIDLQTLCGELKARIREANTKLSHDHGRGVYNKRLLNARTYMEVFRNKAVQELESQLQDSQLPKAKQEVANLQKQLNQQKYETQRLQNCLHKFQRLLSYRFGPEVVREIASEAIRLTPDLR